MEVRQRASISKNSASQRECGALPYIVGRCVLLAMLPCACDPLHQCTTAGKAAGEVIGRGLNAALAKPQGPSWTAMAYKHVSTSICIYQRLFAPAQYACVQMP